MERRDHFRARLTSGEVGHRTFGHRFMRLFALIVGTILNRIDEGLMEALLGPFKVHFDDSIVARQ
jgi:hypothetical protein